MATVLTGHLLQERYRFERLLGSGGFGAVYLAEDLRLQRTVAIKVGTTRRLPPDEADEAARLFQREALTLARLRHPGLTAVWDYFNHDDDWFLVMEYVPGETLRDLLKREGGRLDSARAIDYAEQLCSVLSYVHGQPEPVVFRDLKPANIMVTPVGRLKLIDFGIARLFTPEKMADTSQFGTPGYAPPEQYGGQTEPRSDIFSLGVVLHQMLTGHNPASSPFALPPIRALDPALSPALESIVHKATMREPAQRFATAAEFAMALRSLSQVQATIEEPRTSTTVPIDSITPRSHAPTLTDIHRDRLSAASPSPAPTPVALPGPASRPRRRRRRRGATIVALTLLLVVSLGAAAWLFRPQIAALFDAPVAVIRTGTGGLALPGIVAYVAPNERGGTDLYVRADGEITTLTEHAQGEEASLPAISPDGRRIAYGLYAGGRETLWIVNRDGSGRRQLLDEYVVARAPAWSPDGTRLAVEVARNQGDAWRQHDLVELDLTPQTVRPLLASPGWEGGPSWSPDGSRIAFNGMLDGSTCMSVYLLDLANGQTRHLTEPTPERCSARKGDLWPSWSHDGKRIAFGRKLLVGERLAVMEVASGATDEWNTGTNAAAHPRWSPDGNYLLFEEKPEQGPSSLSRLDLTTGAVEPLDPRLSGALPDWR